MDGRWCGRWLTTAGYARGRGGQGLADALVTDLLRRAELLGPQRDPVLLQQPPHLAQRGRGRPARRAAPRPGGGRPPAGRPPARAAAGRGRLLVEPRRDAGRARRGRPGSAAAAPVPPRRRSRGGPAGRAGRACRSSEASTARSARPAERLVGGAPAGRARRPTVPSSSRIRGSRSRRRSASSASYAGSSRTSAAASTSASTTARRTSSTQVGDRAVGRPGEPELGRRCRDRPARRAGGSGEQQQPGDAGSVPRGGLRERPADPQPDRGALVVERREATDVVAGALPGLLDGDRRRRSTSSGRWRWCRRRPRPSRRRTPRATAPSAPRGPCRGPAPAHARRARGRSGGGARGPSTSPTPHAGRRRRSATGGAARGRRAAAPRPAGTTARKSRAVLGAGTKLTRRCLGRLRSRLVTSSARSPGTFHEKSPAATRLRVATGTSIVMPVVGGARLEVVADREGQPAPPTRGDPLLGVVGLADLGGGVVGQHRRVEGEQVRVGCGARCFHHWSKWAPLTTPSGIRAS